MWFEYFQDGRPGGYLGYRNETNLAIINLHVAPISPIKFGLNPTYHLGGDIAGRFSIWSLWMSWISERNDFSNSESLCLSNAFHQISAQSNLRFGRRCRLNNFKMAPVAAILDIGME